jgi:hypothetical protein
VKGIPEMASESRRVCRPAECDADKYRNRIEMILPSHGAIHRDTARVGAHETNGFPIAFPGFLLMLLTVLTGFLGTGEVHAQMVSGRFVTTFYSFQQYDTSNTAKQSLRGFEAMQLNFGAGNYQLHTYLLATNDFATSIPNDPLLRAANLYFEARKIGDIVNLKLGRQPVFSKVGVSSFDGLSADAKFLDDKISLVAFGGALPPMNEKLELNSNLKDNMLYGAQAYYSPFDNFRVGGAFVDKSFKPPSYYTYRLSELHTSPAVQDSVLIDPSAVANRFVSGDLFYYTDRMSGYFRLDYDLNYYNVNRTEVTFQYSPIRSLSANIGYFHRDSRLPYNSIFSVFDHSGTDELDLGANYMFTQNIGAFGSYSRIFYTGDNSNQFTLGTNIYLFSLSFSHNDGFAGNLNGVNAQFIYPFMDRKFVLIASGSATDYKLLQELTSTNRLYSGSLGLTYRPLNLLSINLQGQYYHDPVYKNDFRGYLQVNYYFFKNFNSN